MRTGLFEEVAQTIESRCSWLRVADTHRRLVYYFQRDDHLQTTTSRCITLEVTLSRGEYWAGHCWQITELELDKVLDDMRNSSPRLRQRCKKLALTEEDVEVMIKRASYGVIDLDIDEDTKPVIN